MYLKLAAILYTILVLFHVHVSLDPFDNHLMCSQDIWTLYLHIFDIKL